MAIWPRPVSRQETTSADRLGVTSCCGFAETGSTATSCGAWGSSGTTGGGSAIGWAFALYYPQSVRALVAVSVGHLRSYGRAGLQQKLGKGLYTLWFQLRGVAEWYLLRSGGLARWLGNEPDVAQIIQRMSRPGRLSAGLNWYRANLLSVVMGNWPRCSRPTLGIWSSADKFLTEAQMRDSATQMDAEWAYRRIDDCAHWIPREQPDLLANLALDWFARHAGQPGA